MTSPTPKICFPDVDWSCCTCNTEAVTDEQRTRAATIAAAQLWALSGRRYGSCEYTVRPCGEDCPSPCTVWNGPYINGSGEWHNGCGCSPGCPCCQVCAVDLHAQLPVQRVTRVRLDGVDVDPDLYRLEGKRLLRLTGPCWPSCQDLNVPLDSPGTFSVNYLAGYTLDAMGLAAYNELACEWLLACTGNSECRLPPNVASLTRQGVTLEFKDLQKTRESGFTGITSVDDWIQMVNPTQSKAPNTVLSPDYRPGGAKISRRPW